MSALDLVDLTGAHMTIAAPMRSVVSLVPSITETLFALGAGDTLVGRTRYCIEPKGRIETIERIGGTKDPNLARIVELAPDIVLANREENREVDVRALRDAGLPVYVSEPHSPLDAMQDVATYGRLTRRENAAGEIVRKTHERLAEMTFDEKAKRPRVACLIWRNPWMAVGSATYIGSMIEALGGTNVFEAHASRYFELGIEDLRAAQPDIVLLPSEPYRFREKHIEELRGLLATRLREEPDIRLCGGQDLSWFGARTPNALLRLQALLR